MVFFDLIHLILDFCIEEMEFCEKPNNYAEFTLCNTLDYLDTMLFEERTAYGGPKQLSKKINYWSNYPTESISS